MALRFYNFVAA